MIKASALNHPKVTQCLRNCLFLLRWALGLLGVFGFRLIVVLTLDNSALLLYLCDIKTTDLQTGMLQNIRLDFLIGCLFLRRGQIQLVHLHFDLDMFLALKFGQ